jgi:transposase-like protein
MCPRCKSSDVSRSRTRKLGDYVMALFRMRPYRCRECQTRFYVPASYARQIDRERAWLREVEKHRRDRTSSQSAE